MQDRPPELVPSEAFLVELARALHVSGAPAHRLEAAIGNAARSLGHVVECSSTPTALFISINHRLRLLRVEPGDVELERLVLVDRLGTEVAGGLITPEAGLIRLRAVLDRSPRYGSPSTVVATALLSASAAVFFAGSPREVLVSLGLGTGVGLLGVLTQRFQSLSRLFTLLAAAFVGATATLLARVLPISVPIATLSGLISLLPGLTITVALAELATRNLASGTARLAGAMVVFLELGVGAALGWRASALLPTALRAVSGGLPNAATPVAILLSTLACVVLFRARPRDVWIIVLVGFLAYGASRGGSLLLGPELGACIGGLVVGLVSNLSARLRDVPASVAQTPGLILLVPGTLGFQGFGALLDSDPTAGVLATFRMFIIAGSLVGGLLVAAVVVPPRRSL